MDNRQQAICNRLETKLVSLLAAKDWKVSAQEIADVLEVTTPDWHSPKAFVASLEPKLPALARQATSRGMSPADVDKASDPLELVNNLLP